MAAECISLEPAFDKATVSMCKIKHDKSMYVYIVEIHKLLALAKSKLSCWF